MFYFTSLLAIVAASQLVHSHFLLNYPATVGFDDDNEGISPCGGFTVDFTGNVTKFHVDGDTIALTSTHPATEWLFRATLNTNATSNFTYLSPHIAQKGLGSFCETGIKAPSTWAGSQGVIQVVQYATDGFLYQCAAVNFTAGAASETPTSCKNSTGVTAVIETSSNTTCSSDSGTCVTGSETKTATTTSTANATANATATGTSTAVASAAAGVSTYATHDALGVFLWVAMTAIGLATALFSL